MSWIDRQVILGNPRCAPGFPNKIIACQLWITQRRLSTLTRTLTRFIQPRFVLSTILTLPVLLWSGILLVSTASLCVAAEPPIATADPSFQNEIRPLLVKYCLECHSDDLSEAEVNFQQALSLTDLRRDLLKWQKVREILNSGQMPPKDALQPTMSEREKLQRWLLTFLTQEAETHAGDPGRVVLRRLSNAEYTYTIRDLTGVPSLDPAAEFPVDGAAGEGFTNTGNALVMSPALLTKYLDAAKVISEHAVLLPDGFRFSPSVSRQDQTNEVLARIRTIYQRYSETREGEKINLQGVVFNTNEIAALPLLKYLQATLQERESLRSGAKSVEQVAAESQLQAKYLQLLWTSLNAPESSFALEKVRSRWATSQSDQAGNLVDEVNRWQSGLWKFSPVGGIGKVDEVKHWQEAVTPLVSERVLRFKIPAGEPGKPVLVGLYAGDAGDGHEHDFVIWDRPRFVAPGQPEVLLKDVQAGMLDFSRRRQLLLEETAACLQIAATVRGPVDIESLAAEHEVDPQVLRGWFRYLGIGVAPTRIHGHLTRKITEAGKNSSIQGWGADGLPQVLANSSDEVARIPGRVDPHHVVVHPSPDRAGGVAWECPQNVTVGIQASVQPVHAECGNGVTWKLELRRNGTSQRLASGVAGGPKLVPIGPFEKVSLQAKDVIALVIGARGGNHSCDLTAIDLTLTPVGNDAAIWNLAKDVSAEILAGNPHADRQGNPEVWSFFAEPDDEGSGHVRIPAGSLLAKWQTTTDSAEQAALAAQIQQLLNTPSDGKDQTADAELSRKLMSFDGPLFSDIRTSLANPREQASKPDPKAQNAKPASDSSTGSSLASSWGLPASLFGTTPQGEPIEAASLCVQAPALIQFQLPHGLASGYELVVTARLLKSAGHEGSVQLAVGKGVPDLPLGRVSLLDRSPSEQGAATSRPPSSTDPILISTGSQTEQRLQKAFDDFRSLFPVALCYPKIVPADATVTLTLFHREDDHLCRLMLSEEEQTHLNRLWSELHFIGQTPLIQMDAFAQLLEYSTQDGNPSRLEPFRAPLTQQAEAFRQQQLQSEPKHVAQLLPFAEQAFRRPLLKEEQAKVIHLYDTLRREELSHEVAFRLTLAKLLVSPDFLYHVEIPGPGTKANPVSDWELASRLSYFLWSSQPDAELRALAAAGHLQDPAVLTAQAKRMLQDERCRRLATEFACQWLHVYDFDELDEKSEQQFPTFVDVRADLYEETIRFFQDLFQNNGSVGSILDADHTFLNESLARHYNIPGITGDEWQRVDGMRAHHRGGILAHGTTLAKQSGASRTSPTLRGAWVSEVLLGERLPRPPKDVPLLPDDPAEFAGLTVRQLVEKHASDERCAVCHVRVDPMGFALESFDAIGRHRERDLGDFPLDTQVAMPDGTTYTGLDGLRDYLLTVRRETFLKQFSRKMLGYALGRAVQLSDEPLLTHIRHELQEHDEQVLCVIEQIIHSRQFREIRGREAAHEESY